MESQHVHHPNLRDTGAEEIRTLGHACTYEQSSIRPSLDGEFRRGCVAYDRANLATALGVWLPQAEQGDKVAQTNVGEIYEKGVGAAPDYANAATWYRKAADQGYARALTNLGFLYEQGLGVAKDPVAALNLYRKAAGIEGAISLEGAARQASSEDLDALRRELARTRKDLENARRALDEERLKSSRDIERLLQQKGQAAAAGNAEETRRLESLLKEREAELERRREQVTQAEQAAENYLDEWHAAGWKTVKTGIGRTRAFAEAFLQRRLDAVMVPEPAKGDIPRKAMIAKEWKEIRKKL